MNKEEIEKALKLFDREDLIDDVVEDLDTDIGVFMTVNQMIYYSKLQQENKQLKEQIDKAIKRVNYYLNTIGEIDINEVLEILKGEIDG